MNRIGAAGPLLMGCVLALGAAPVALGQRAAEVDTLIRGENVRLWAAPAANADVVAILQRGDEILITGDADLPNGDKKPETAATLGIAYDVYVPVEAVETGQTGWVSEIFIDPRSFVPVGGAAAARPANLPPRAAETPAAAEPPAAGNAGQGNRRQNRQNQQANAAETTPEATGGGRRNRRQNRQNQQSAAAETTPEAAGAPAAGNRRNRNRNATTQQTTTESNAPGTASENAADGTGNGGKNRRSNNASSG